MQSSVPTRRHDLDALRGFAMLLGNCPARRDVVHSGNRCHLGSPGFSVQRVLCHFAGVDSWMENAVVLFGQRVFHGNAVEETRAACTSGP